MPHIRKMQRNGSLTPRWWEWKMVQLLRKVVGHFLSNWTYSCPVTQQLDAWVFMPEKWRIMFTQKPVNIYLQQLYLLQPKTRKNADALQGEWVNKLLPPHAMEDDYLHEPGRLSSVWLWSRMAHKEASPQTVPTTRCRLLNILATTTLQKGAG